MLEGEPLPEVTHGTALFADIAGFTALTEKLSQGLGARRGIEELTRRINAVYQPLIGEVERFGGSVINFAGDSITCWFDERAGSAALRAVSSAVGMQQAMTAFENLGLKIATTTGTVRRLAVGDPAIQLMDTLAGSTVVRLATGEHLAKQGEVLLDERTCEALGAQVSVREWRTAESGEQFGLLDRINLPLDLLEIDSIPSHLDGAALQSWVPPVVFERECSGLGTFITELRPSVALFLRFTGIDYDKDDYAGSKLDAFIRGVQKIVHRFGGNLLQLTMGDKGSYLYASFGIPVAHEDDTERAAMAAWELSQLPKEFPFLEPLQIGISQGTMRAGAYGSPTRQTYGAMGDDTNLAARLMMKAAPGEILVSSRVYKQNVGNFNHEPRPPLPLKGKSEPLPVFAITNPRRRRAVRLEEPAYTLPMMGRQAELDIIQEKLEQALQGHGQIIAITGDAGMGKSRLVAEVIRLANHTGFASYGGACEASGTNTPYLVWRSIWQAFFDIDPEASQRRQLRNLEGEIEDRAPHRLQAMPVLSTLLQVEIDENEFTRTLEPKDRRNVLTALLEDCLKSAAREEPHLLVVEDLQWVDPLSQDLLENLARVCTNLPVCILVAYRPLEALRLQTRGFETLPHFTRLELVPLQDAEAEQLVRAKLAQLYPEKFAPLPKGLAEKLISRAEGNPFYIEELLNYLRDRGQNPYNLQSLLSLELPSSLHSLILSRIDQLTETQKTTLKVASIIGRLFQVSWLHQYYPALGETDAVKSTLDRLAHVELTLLDTPEPELAYFFKHILTRQVAYESLPYATRARLHELLAEYIVMLGEDRYLDLLAYHYGFSENTSKQIEYFHKAGDAAKAAYANQAALSYFERLEPLLAEPGARIHLYLTRGELYELIGEWKQAEEDYRSALQLSQQIGDKTTTVQSQLALGTVYRLQGDYPAAMERLELADNGAHATKDRFNQAQVGLESGKVLELTGKLTLAIEKYRSSLELAQEHQDLKTHALALLSLGSVYSEMGKYAEAQKATVEALQISNTINDKEKSAIAFNRLGLLAMYQGDLTEAKSHYEECLRLSREIGDKLSSSNALNNLAMTVKDLGDHDLACSYYTECLAISREIDDKRGIALATNNLGVLAINKADYKAAQEYYQQSLEIFRELGEKQNVATSLLNLGYLACERDNFDEAQPLILESLEIFQEVNTQWGTVYSLVGLAAVSAGKSDFPTCVKLASAAETLRRTINLALEADGRRLYERAIASARDGLDKEDFDSAWKEGEDLSLEQIKNIFSRSS